MKRFRDVADMPLGDAPSKAPLEDRIAAAWERAHIHGSTPLFRGVRRFRTIEESQAFRRQVTAERIQRIKDSRQPQ